MNKNTLKVMAAGLVVATGMGLTACGKNDKKTVVSHEFLNYEKNWEVDDNFSLDGAKLKLKLKDGSTKEVSITEGMIKTKPDMTSVGTKNVVITYDGKEYTITITVAEKADKRLMREMIQEFMTKYNAAGFGNASAKMELAGFVKWFGEVYNIADAEGKDPTGAVLEFLESPEYITSVKADLMGYTVQKAYPKTSEGEKKLAFYLLTKTYASQEEMFEEKNSIAVRDAGVPYIKAEGFVDEEGNTVYTSYNYSYDISLNEYLGTYLENFNLEDITVDQFVGELGNAMFSSENGEGFKHATVINDKGFADFFRYFINTVISKTTNIDNATVSNIGTAQTPRIVMQLDMLNTLKSIGLQLSNHSLKGLCSLLQAEMEYIESFLPTDVAKTFKDCLKAVSDAVDDEANFVRYDKLAESLKTIVTDSAAYKKYADQLKSETDSFTLFNDLYTTIHATGALGDEVDAMLQMICADADGLVNGTVTVDDILTEIHEMCDAILNAEEGNPDEGESNSGESGDQQGADTLSMEDENGEGDYEGGYEPGTSEGEEEPGMSPEMIMMTAVQYLHQLTKPSDPETGCTVEDFMNNAQSVMEETLPMLGGMVGMGLEYLQQNKYIKETADIEAATEALMDIVTKYIIPSVDEETSVGEEETGTENTETGTETGDENDTETATLMGDIMEFMETYGTDKGKANVATIGLMINFLTGKDKDTDYNKILEDFELPAGFESVDYNKLIHETLKDKNTYDVIDLEDVQVEYICDQQGNVVKQQMTITVNLDFVLPIAQVKGCYKITLSVDCK